MPSLNLLVVGEEKALVDFEEALESCKRYVGPIKMFTAHKAVDAVGRLQKLVQTCGVCHAAFLSNHFTAPGKEEFSDTLRKVLKEKYPDVPVVCWGHPKKGGELNKNYHATVEYNKNNGDINALVDILKQVQAGQIKAEYLHKGDRKSLDRRNSLDRSDSVRGSSSPSMRRTDSRRASFEGGRPPALDRNASSRRTPDEDAPAASPTLQSVPTARRKEAAGAAAPVGASAGLGMGTGVVGGMSGMGGGMGAGMGGMGMGMGGISPMGGLGASPGGSMNAGMGMGMGLGGGMGMGMAPAMGAGLATSGSMNSGMGMGLGYGSAGSGDVTAMMQGMHVGGSSGGAVGMAAPAPAPAPAPSGGNGELIKMLAEEVVRLRKAVEDKRAREAEAAAAQQQLQQLQQQQLLLQQQLAAAGGMGMSMGGGMGGGMPLGI